MGHDSHVTSFDDLLMANSQNNVKRITHVFPSSANLVDHIYPPAPCVIQGYCLFQHHTKSQKRRGE